LCGATVYFPLKDLQMKLNLTTIFREFGDEIMRLPRQEEVFDCLAAERMFAVMGEALQRILKLQQAALTEMLDDGEEGKNNLEILAELEQTKLILNRLELHHGRLHNFFLQPHLYDPLEKLTLVRKETLEELDYRVTEIEDLNRKVAELSVSLRRLLDEGTRGNHELTFRRR